MVVGVAFFYYKLNCTSGHHNPSEAQIIVSGGLKGSGVEMTS